MKICSKCKIEIPNNYYSGLCHKCRKYKNYLNSTGKKFNRFKSVPKEKQLENKRALARQYYHNNKESINAKRKREGENKENKDKKSKSYAKWYDEKGKKYYKNKYNNDINFKLSRTLRARLNKAIKNNQKAGSAVSDLDCSIEEFKEYMESKFLPGMSWDNWSRDGWHIDHIRPLYEFDLTDEQQFKEACHYTNLQPLWAKDNLSKGNRLDTLT